MSKTIVFIHGLFQNPKSWDHWVRYFEQRGYVCHTPAYPFHEGDPAELRRHIHPDLGKLTFGDVVRSLEEFLNVLPEKPILIGHSMGGLLVQKLIALEKGMAGVCIDSAAPRGVFSFEWSFWKANFPTINPLKGDSVCVPSAEWLHYAFCNMMTLEQAKDVFDKFAVPESRRIPRSSITESGAVDFSKPHAPLLFIAGEKDTIIPASLNRKNFEAYKDKDSVRSYKEFPGRTHYICGQENWEEVAGYVHAWLKEYSI